LEFNLNNIELNKRYKYKQLCEVLNIKQKTCTSSKKSQLKELQCYFNIFKDKTLYTIIEIYDNPSERIDGRKENRGGYNARNYHQYKVDRKHDKNKGVYSIILFNDIYIGSTTSGFRPRFQQHINKSNKSPTYTMLNNDATYQILWIANNETEQQIRNKENEYIEYYINQEDWNLINTREAWSYTVPKQKYKTIKLKIKENDYEYTIKLLKDNLIDVI
jgi:hypothetical protein